MSVSYLALARCLSSIISMLLSISGLDFLTSISGAASAISNVGPGMGDIIGPDGNYKSIPDVSKWILSVGMLLGRLELTIGDSRHPHINSCSLLSIILEKLIGKIR